MADCDFADLEMAQRLPAPAVVTEWDNALTCGAERASRSLAVLAGQLRQLTDTIDGEAELIITFDPSRVSRQAILDALSASGGETGWPTSVSFQPVAPDATYADYKNEGIGLTRREILVFFEPDVIPEPDWLKQILLPFLNPHISVVAGSTYVGLGGLYSRAFALFWYFHPRRSADGLRLTNYVYGNNVAFRRQVFQQFPFPDDGFRSNIFRHARAIWRGGFPVFQQMSARASHPPPFGAAAFVRRAVAQGHDLAVLPKDDPAYLPPVPSFIRLLRTAAARISRRRKELDADWGTVTFAGALALIFYCLVFAGHVVGRSHPQFLRRHFFY